jgi:hypothetical protein
VQSTDEHRFQVGQQVKVKQGSSSHNYAERFIGKVGTITAFAARPPADATIGYDVRIDGTGFRVGEDWLEEA